MPYNDFNNINDFIFSRKNLEGSKFAFYVDDLDGGYGEITYQYAYQKVKAISALYRNIGIKPLQRVAIVADESIYSIYAIFACFQIGAVATIINPNYADDEILSAVTNAHVSLMVKSQRIAPVSGITVIEIERLVIISEKCEVLEGAERCSADHPAAIFFTSGSTGEPKKVSHTHSDIYNTCENYGRNLLSLGCNHRLFSASKSFFVYGFNSIHMGLAFGGGVVLAPDRPSSEEIVNLIARYQPTHFFSIPTIFLRLLNDQVDVERFSSIELFVSAGEPLPKVVFDKWKSLFQRPIIDGIGTSETMCTVISNSPEDYVPGCTGRAVPGFEIKLINESGNETKPGELGIMWVKGNTISKGYADMNPDEYVSFFVDGWYKSNDVFYKDENDRFYFQGRSNDMVKVGGEWLSPYKIEAALNRHPEVREVAVTLCNQVELLARPIAYVVPHSLKNGGEESLIKRLKVYCKEVLSRNQYPHFLHLVESLPKTHTGKLKRYMLRINENQSGKYFDNVTQELTSEI